MYGVPTARLGHHLGDRTVRLPGRRHGVHIHSPVRNYYMSRNTLLLVRSGLLPPAWRVGYVFWIIKYAVFYVLMIRPRWERCRLLVRGLADGLRGRTGPLR
jgi:rhamnosyltransferase